MFIATTFIGVRADTFTIGYPEEVNDFHNAAAAILKEAYGQLGIQLEFVTFPSERSLVNSDEGRIDGELVRIKGLEAKYHSLLMVPVSHIKAEQMAFALDKNIGINGWDSIRNYRIAFQRGYKAAEAGTRGMDNITLTVNTSQAIDMLIYKRVDIVVANRFTGLKELADRPGNSVVMLTPALQEDLLYHYLNSRHKDLLPKITEILTRMKEEGHFKRIYDAFKIAPISESL